MTEAADRLRMQHFLKGEYTTSLDAEPDRRVANALDYIAFHMGQIDKKLDDIIKALELAAGKQKRL